MQEQIFNDTGEGNKRFLITLAVMIPAIIVVLEITILGVALPSMMGALQANSQQITWVMTSYIAASSVLLPISGFLVKRYGIKNIVLISVGAFFINSLACALTTNLWQMVIFRALQGLSGAALIPITQGMMNNLYPDEERAKGQAIFGISVMVAPIMGPFLGGVLTYYLSWRWIFYLNLPLCLASFILVFRHIPTTKIKRSVKVDWIGLASLISLVLSLQILLDQGVERGWFTDSTMLILFGIALFSLVFFIVWGIGKDNAIINFKLFTKRNFVLATLLMAYFSIYIYGFSTFVPLLMQNTLGYSPLVAGLAIFPRGLSAFFSMLLGVWLVRKLGPKRLLFMAIILATLATYFVASIHSKVDFSTMALIMFLQGFPAGLFFIPLSIIMLSHLDKQEAYDASGLFNFARTLGGAFGLSYLGTIFSYGQYYHWNNLVKHINETNQGLMYWLKHVNDYVSEAPIHLPYKQLITQINILSYNGTFEAIVIGLLFCMIALVIMKKVTDVK